MHICMYICMVLPDRVILDHYCFMIMFMYMYVCVYVSMSFYDRVIRNRSYGGMIAYTRK